MTLERPLAAAAPVPTFAEAAEEHLDDVYGYLLYLTQEPGRSPRTSPRDVREGAPAVARFDPRRGTPRTWLLAIARTTALDWFRADSRRRRREEAAAPPEPGRGVVRRGPLARARGGARDAHRRRARGGRAARRARPRRRATARLLGISPTAVSTRLSRALKRLEERMTQMTSAEIARELRAARPVARRRRCAHGVLADAAPRAAPRRLAPRARCARRRLLVALPRGREPRRRRGRRDRRDPAPE